MEICENVCNLKNQRKLNSEMTIFAFQISKKKKKCFFFFIENELRQPQVVWSGWSVKCDTRNNKR